MSMLVDRLLAMKRTLHLLGEDGHRMMRECKNGQAMKDFSEMLNHLEQIDMKLDSIIEQVNGRPTAP